MAIKKRYLLGKDARDKLLEGAKIVYDLVSVTSGPKGRNIAYARPWGLPRIINDGIEIAKEIGSEDDFVNPGIDLIREAASNTVTDAGDGTTTSIILAYHVLKQGMDLINEGRNPMVIRTQLLECLSVLLKEIPNLSTKVTSPEELRRVALISSSGDEEIAEQVSKTVYEMGPDGIVTAEEGNLPSIVSEVTKGMQITKGYLDPLLVTDEMRMESVILNPSILVFEKIITAQSELIAIMNEIAKVTKNVVMFGDIRGEALASIVINKMRGTFQILAVNPPGYQERRLAQLQDIAAVVGATIITAATQQYHNSMLGTASHVTANKTTTTIASGGGKQAAIEQRANELRSKISSGESTLYDKEQYQERLSKLVAGVGLIKVGARSETLKREKFEKTKDAIGASKAALAEGIVVGGGMAFLELARKIEKDNKEMNDGQRILYNALLAPTQKLLYNSGKTDSEVKALISRLLRVGKNEGYNVNTDKIEDLMKSGVVDPTRVIRLALENAVVVATSKITAEGLIIDAPQPEQAPGRH